MERDDRVLVAYVPSVRDFSLIEAENWYRIPIKHAPKGIHAEWIAFYFGKKFGERKYAVHLYAKIMGHELVQRRDLLPHEPQHPRADEWYYKIQLGALHERDQPIISLRWRRILFIHTTGDRFMTAVEINDLLIKDNTLVNRAETALHDDPATPYLILHDAEQA